MTVTVKIQDGDGNILVSFPAENNKSIAEMAAEHGIEILQSCSEWYCGTCLCEVNSGAEMVDINKTGDHLYDLEMDADNHPKQMLACIGGITDEAFESEEEHVLLLTKLY